MSSNDKKKNKKLALKALWNCKGNMSKAAELTGLSRRSIWSYASEDPEFKKELIQIRESRTDHVEEKLHELISGVSVESLDSNGDQVVYERAPCKTSIIFYLKTQAKDRGYIERKEITGKDGEELGLWTVIIKDKNEENGI